MSSLDQMFEVLNLFSESRPIWSINDATQAMRQSRSTVYRYFRALTTAGLLAPVTRGAYALGPFIIKLDRQIRLCDPLLRVAPPVMARLQADSGCVVMLGRLFHNDVLCIHQEGYPDDMEVTFARGRPSSLFRGAMPKAILANLPTNQLKDIFLKRNEEIRNAGLGDNWPKFKASLRKIRKDGFYVSKAGEVDPKVIGIGAPIFDPKNAVFASVNIAVPERQCTEAKVRRWVELVRGAAAEITKQLAALDATSDHGRPSAEADVPRTPPAKSGRKANRAHRPGAGRGLGQGRSTTVSNRR
jgi:DNA-binding IclR family transcriptional regulator